jgi:PAS domain S-box-containing protein
MVALLLGYVVCDYLFVDPRGAIHLANARDFERLLRYLLSGGLIIAFGEGLRAALRRADQHRKRLEVEEKERRRFEQALRQSEVRFRALADTVPVHIWILDAAGKGTFGNARFFEFVGVDPQKFSPFDWPRFLHPQDSEQFVRGFQSAVAQRVEYRASVRLLRHDGAYRWFDVIGLPHFERDQFIGYLGCSIDVTDSRQADEARRQSEQRFVQFMQHLPGLAWIKDAAGRYVFANDAAEKAFHARRSELYDKTDLEIFPPQTARQFQQNDQRALASPSGVQVIETLEHDDRVVHHSLVSKFPIPGPDGQPALVGGMAIDITDRVHAEETVRSLLRISKRLNSSLDVDALLDILVQEAIQLVGAESGVAGLCTPEGMVCQTYFHKGQAVPLRYVWPPMHGLPGWLLVHKVPYVTNDAAGDPQIVGELCERFGVWSAVSTPILTAANEILGFFEIHNKKDGSAFNTRDQDHLVAVAQAAAIAIQNALAYRQLQRAEASLKEADQRKDEFLATLAHELRNPLAPIRNAVELLGQSGDDRAVLEQARSILQRQSTQMVRLIDDLLDISRITRNKLELRKTRVKLVTVVDSAMEAARPLVESAGHQLTVELPGEAVELEADPTRLAQVFANLLTNAAKYTDHGGQIRLAAERIGSDVVVSVRDNGIGIAPQHLPRVFEMFSQVAPALERSQGGLGIGLALVKGLVEMHGGHVEAHSAGLGKGSQFVVRLPVPGSVAAEQSPAGADEPAASAACRILVADDNKDSAETLALLLRKTGNDVRTAYDGLEAVNVAATFLPDVVMLDIGMPRLNGYDAARRLREQPWGKHMLLIAMTGWGQDEDKRRAAEAGFDHHFTKPVDITVLHGLLATLALQGQA